MKAPLPPQILRFDGVDGFTTRNREAREPLQLPGLGRLSLEAIPAGAWPILLERAGATTRVYFHVFLSRLVICWQMDEGAAEPSLQVAPPEFDTVFHQARDSTSADPVWEWIRLKREAQEGIRARRIRPASQDVFTRFEQDIIGAGHRATNTTEFIGQVIQILYQMAQNSGLDSLAVAKLVTPVSTLAGIDDPFLSMTTPHLQAIRDIFRAWANLTRDFSSALDTGSMETRAPPVISSLHPFADINTMRIRFAADRAKRPQLQLQIAPAMIRSAQRGEKRHFGRTLVSLQHLARALEQLNRSFCDGRELAFSFDDNSGDPGLRFDRARGSKEPLIPDLHLLREIEKWEATDRSPEIYQAPPFLERKKQLFWRGSTTGPFILSLEEFRDNHRVKACLHTLRELPAHADCKIARIVQTPQELRQEARRFLRENKILSPIIDARDFAQYQMFLDLPGNASAWGSCIRYLQGMLVFRVAHEHELLYYEALQPWVHYIPVAADLSDLKSGVEWALLHQNEAAQIATKGQAIMLEFLASGMDILENVVRDNLQKAEPAASA